VGIEADLLDALVQLQNGHPSASNVGLVHEVVRDRSGLLGHRIYPYETEEFERMGNLWYSLLRYSNK